MLTASSWSDPMAGVGEEDAACLWQGQSLPWNLCLWLWPQTPGGALNPLPGNVAPEPIAVSSRRSRLWTQAAGTHGPWGCRALEGSLGVPQWRP